MLSDISAKLTTQKLLLVPHSQGNFYANAIYSNLADKPGGLPAGAIGIFGVASPASHINGGGDWITSDTDEVIAGIVGGISPKGILPTNTTIIFNDSDGDPLGHDFTKIYLKYKTPEIISGITSSLDKLRTDSGRREDMPCVAPPELTFMDKVDSATLAVLDHPSNPLESIAFVVANVEIKIVSGVYAIGQTIVGVVNTTAAFLSSTVSSLFFSDNSSGGGSGVCRGGNYDPSYRHE